MEKVVILRKNDIIIKLYKLGEDKYEKNNDIHEELVIY